MSTPSPLLERRILEDRRERVTDALAAWRQDGTIERRVRARRAIDNARVSHWCARFDAARNAAGLPLAR